MTDLIKRAGQAAELTAIDFPQSSQTIRDLIAALQAPVQVRPLVWEEKVRGVHMTVVNGKRYSIYEYPTECIVEMGYGRLTKCADLDEAKAFVNDTHTAWATDLHKRIFMGAGE